MPVNKSKFTNQYGAQNKVNQSQDITDQELYQQEQRLSRIGKSEGKKKLKIKSVKDKKRVYPSAILEYQNIKNLSYLQTPINSLKINAKQKSVGQQQSSNIYQVYEIDKQTIVNKKQHISNNSSSNHNKSLKQKQKRDSIIDMIEGEYQEESQGDNGGRTSIFSFSKKDKKQHHIDKFSLADQNEQDHIFQTKFSLPQARGSIQENEYFNNMHPQTTKRSNFQQHIKASLGSHTLTSSPSIPFDDDQLTNKHHNSFINEENQQNQTQDSTAKKLEIPMNYQDWKKIESMRMKEKQMHSLPNQQLDRERKLKLHNVQSKIRQDAIQNGKANQEETLEDGLRQKLSRLRQINVQEEPFTYSLSKVHDRTFISKILPCVQRQQHKYSPIGASNSKSPNLLRNTFSVEMYGEFLKHKNKLKEKQKQQVNAQKEQENKKLNKSHNDISNPQQTNKSTMNFGAFIQKQANFSFQNQDQKASTIVYENQMDYSTPGGFMNIQVQNLSGQSSRSNIKQQKFNTITAEPTNIFKQKSTSLVNSNLRIKKHITPLVIDKNIENLSKFGHQKSQQFDKSGTSRQQVPQNVFNLSSTRNKNAQQNQTNRSFNTNSRKLIKNYKSNTGTITPRSIADKIKINDDLNDITEASQNKLHYTSQPKNESMTPRVIFPRVKKTTLSETRPTNGTRGSMGKSQQSFEVNSLLSAIGLSFKEKMEFMQQKRAEQEKKKQFLNSLKKKGKQNDVDFFTSLEQKDMDSRLIEIIMFEVNKMFAKEMAKYRNVTSEFNTMLKRKNLLEAKLFKKRYEKVQKHLNGIPNMESTLNPFKRQYQPSIFNESLVDSKMDIPNNKELYENVIKEAFGDLADPDEDADQEQLKQMSDKEIIERIRMKYRRRVLKEGPSILNQPDKPSRFLEQMMKLCNFQRISNKIQGGMNKYQRSLRLKHKSFSVNPQSPPELEKDEDDDNNKSSFFITQAFMPLPSVEITTPTLKLGNQSLRTPVKSNQSSPNITNYLNFLATNLNRTQRPTDNKTFNSTSGISLKPHLRSSRYLSKKNLDLTSPAISTQNRQTYQNSPTESLLRNASKMSKTNTDISPQILNELEREIQIKDDIKVKARAKTLSTKDWEQIGQSRILQFTILDRIIEDCSDYDKAKQEKLMMHKLGLSGKKNSILGSQTLQNSSTNNSSFIMNQQQQFGASSKHQHNYSTTISSKENLIQDVKKKNIEDTLTFLEKLKRMNKLSHVEKLNFD